MKKCVLLIIALMHIWLLPVEAAETLVPVGTVVGLELENKTVTVAAFDTQSQAKTAGLREGDRILSMNGKPISCAEDVRKGLACSHGSVELLVQRKEKTLRITVAPEITAEGPKLGVYLKEGVTGIGTITYYDPETGIFGTLGHGVNDGNGTLIQLTGGKAYEAKIASVRKGKSGQPGQLVGSLTQREPMGSLYRNTTQGVFGKTHRKPQGEAIPVANADQIHTGSAVILSTVAGDTPQEYSVEILKVYSSGRGGGRNMLLKVTDPTLLETTGGIVQGMSGSPIIQDGKLIGAVTHVLVNDPTTGYGIFIENMLNAAA